MRLIDADALLEKMSTHCDLCQYNDHMHHCRRECDWHEAIDEVEDMDETPSVEINVSDEVMARAFRPVLNDLQLHGHWYEDDKTYAGAGMANYKCSACEKICGTWVKGLQANKLYAYCPWCGAKMDEETERSKL